MWHSRWSAGLHGDHDPEVGQGAGVQAARLAGGQFGAEVGQQPAILHVAVLACHHHGGHPAQRQAVRCLRRPVQGVHVHLTIQVGRRPVYSNTIVSGSANQVTASSLVTHHHETGARHGQVGDDPAAGVRPPDGDTVPSLQP